MTRVAGKLGRLPQKPEGERFAIKYLHEYTPLAAPTYPIDVSQGITDWGMLNNNVLGDCGPAGYEHDRMLSGAHPTADETSQLYLTYTGGQDVGVVIADFLLWLFQHGEIAAFAPLELSTVDAWMFTSKRGGYLGVNLTDNDENEFNNGQPWDGATPPDPNNGHVVLKTGSQAAGGAGPVVTWGAEQLCEPPWLAKCVEEAWAILTADDLQRMPATAVDALLADLRALPNSHVTTPPPAPSPTPTPPIVTPPPTPSEPPPFPGALAEVSVALHQAAASREMNTTEFLNRLFVHVYGLHPHA